MEACEKLAKCPFYQGQMSMEKGLGAMYKKKYCEGNKLECARYMIATTLGPEYVTNQIFPNMTAVAQEMIEKNRNN